MTELEKKQSGEIYDARDPELRRLQNKAKNLMRQYNEIPAENTDDRMRVLEELFGAIGKNARVNQPIYVDYGKNIHLGSNSLINMHCTLLDTGADRNRRMRHDRAGCQDLYLRTCPRRSGALLART